MNDSCPGDILPGGVKKTKTEVEEWKMTLSHSKRWRRSSK